MKFTKETLKRALRTFIQAAIAYIVANIALVDFTDKSIIKSAVIGLITSAVAAGIAAVMNLEQPTELGAGDSTVTFDNWVKANLGKGIDYDGVYGVQCVDLIKHFVKNVLGVTPQSIGNAIEYYNKRSSSKYLTDNFKWLKNTPDFVPQKGDICVFTSKSGNGHVSIATGEGTTSYFYSYDQNYPSGKHEPMTKIKHSYSSFLGVLRPKEQTNIKVKDMAKNSICTLFPCNATMKSAQTVYVDNLKTTKAGSVSKGERVRALTNGASYSIIQYGTSAKGYKAGIVPTSSVIRD